MRKDLMGMAKMMGKLSIAKKEGKLPTYEASYTDAVANKWKDKGGKAAYIKAAKAYNEKKYGTTEPTKVSNKITGGSKTKLAEANTVLTKTVKPKTEKEKLSNPKLEVSSLKKKPSLNVDTKIKAKPSKKEQRKSKRSERQNQREVDRALRKNK
tara:strand:+ start:62 stop:523 length:462 start_codon:yes stop_codon:yes gene_type:complete